MASSVVELLQPQVVLRVISRIRDGRGPMAAWLGWYPTSAEEAPNGRDVTLSGPNTMSGGGGVVESVRNVTYRIFDNTRVVMKARAPGTGPATVSQNPMGQNTVSVARFHQKIPLLYEFLGNLAAMVGPNSQVDAGGQAYITQQTTFLAEQANNAVEAMAAGMMRDSLWFINYGDNWLPSFTAPTGSQVGFQVAFQIPAGNKAQLNMLGTGNIIGTAWNDVSAPIFGNLQSIIAAYAQLTRYRLTDAWINSTMWVNIVTNTEIRNLAGSSNTPFAEFEDDLEPDWMENAGPANRYSAILKCQPMVTWNFNDDTVAMANPPTVASGDVDPSYTQQPAGTVGVLNKLVPDNMVIFSTMPSSKWQQFYLGGEYVVENPGMPGALRRGWYAWHEYVTQPSAIELITLLNGTPLLYIPSVVAPATVIF